MYNTGNIPNSVEVLRMDMVESGTSKQQYYRPFSTVSASPDAIDVLRENIATAKKVGVGTVSGIAGSIVNVDAAPTGMVHIDDHGWGQRRMLFMLHVRMHYAGTSAPIEQIMFGWGEHTDLTLQGTVDPHMPFTIDTTMTLREETKIGRGGRRTKALIPIDTSYLVADNGFKGLQFDNDRDPKMRIDPYSVANLMVTSSHALDAGEDAQKSLYNYAAAHNKVPTKINRAYTSKTNWLGTILSGFAAAKRSGEDGGGDHGMLCQAAQRNMTGMAAHADGFLLAIRGVSNMRVVSNVFTLADLERLHPDFPGEVYMTDARPGRMQRTSSRFTKSLLGEHIHMGDSDEWGAADEARQIAHAIGQAIPSVMASVFAVELRFTASNSNVENEMVVSVLGVQPFIDFEFTGMVDKLIAKLETEVMAEASNYNAIGIDLEFYGDLRTEFMIDIQVNGGERFTLQVPVYASASSTSMLTETTRANGIAGDLDVIVQDVICGNNTNNTAMYDPRRSKQGIYTGAADDHRSDYDDHGGNTPPRRNSPFRESTGPAKTKILI